jgi:hypothetical protein
MRTGRILRGIATLMVILSTQIANGQNQDSATKKNGPFQKYWTRPRTVPKFGAGMQDRAFVEIGLIYQSVYRHPLSLASHGGYFTVDVFIDDKNLLLGPKAGYEFTAGFLGIGADVTYFIDNRYNEDGDNRRAWVITPKAGISILGFANLFYGYQFPVSDERITSISRHRFSMTINLNRDYFNLNDAPRR